MRKRGPNGKYIKNDDIHQTQEEENFYGEFKKSLVFLYRLWRYAPILLILWMLWKYFQIVKKAEGVLLEIICGANCTCYCKASPKATPDTGL